jgi:hypothetical protein
MAHIGMDHEHHHNGHDFGGTDGWVDLNHGYNSSQHQSPIFEHGGFGFMQPIHNGLAAEQSYNPQQRIAQPPPPHTTHQQLLPLIMPSHPTWPSMLTNPASYPAPPVAIPATAPPLLKMTGTKLPAIHNASPRKTLTDSDRRRMCQYHEENPSVKQTEIGGESMLKNLRFWCNVLNIP